jgi:RIO kinase 1
VHARLDRAGLEEAWTQLLVAMHAMVRCGVVHGDLSPYNILWDVDRVVIIDLPQAVDPIAHPEGLALLQRDVANVSTWFTRRGVRSDPDLVFQDLLDDVFHT